MNRLGFFITLILLSIKLSGQIDCNINTYSIDSAWCYGETVYLYTNFSDTLNYYWEPNGETGVIIEVTVKEPVTYILHVSNDDNSYTCTDSLYLAPLPDPVLKIHYSPEQVIANETVTFTFECIYGDVGLLTDWDWHILGLTYNGIENLPFVFSDPGYHNVRLDYWTANGCQESIQAGIDVGQFSVGELFDHDLSFYPNPASDQIIFHYNLRNKARVEFNIYDMHGQCAITLVPETVLQGRQTNICDVSKISPGVYFLKLMIGKEVYITKIVIL